MPDAAGLLRRLAKAPPPLTPARALRLAVTRAAEGALGLPLAVLSVREEEGELDDLLGRLEDGLMLLALRQGGQATGLVALDAEGRAAAIEAQALGRIAPAAPDPREPTAADAALARPFLAAALREGEGALAGTPLEGWLGAAEVSERVAPREAPLLLGDGRYRALRLALDLGAGGRQGLLLVLARLAPPRAQAAPTLAPLVLAAPTPVDAILHRLRVPLSVVEGWAEGDLLPLPGVTVGSLSLESRGSPLAPARLGQSAGMRAVRIEAAVTPDLSPLPRAAPPPLLPDAPAWDLPPPEEPAPWEPPADLPTLDWPPPEQG